MEDLARSMASEIRQGDCARTVFGTVHAQAPSITVQWVWILLPVSMITLCLIFLITTMKFSEDNSKAIWKPSTLATLFHGLEVVPYDDSGHLTISQMRLAASVKHVQLEEDRLADLNLLVSRDRFGEP
ncbi:hypothetical protein CLAFUW4_07546 [Fulvia fulva]|uniref:Uncharacterized protein n=1 Tax=Passalora fulva TaxID=5499 RepID=A0A9Q8PB47_PASFU|nr:uncharacterized protein CLAFUR5_07677 [Fulvia fulva]KAK4621977.1 hypothetical protein CLAFUR4_07552 [Fulvia fulva]KAK4622675.1 hypothetical protein CLAFUR0_07551 [Fulvia fulva]UJO19186.1 hypothetical protein CLAFUR5_07677 [Fulvia fulva]WPV16636.1 hypothetical protein CLAFUW4_07546 [Fulvia fulva]WPV30780.1 hypothetical protein CLAFUW7_07548 [Fulvia fulva]